MLEKVRDAQIKLAASASQKHKEGERAINTCMTFIVYDLIRKQDPISVLDFNHTSLAFLSFEKE